MLKKTIKYTDFNGMERTEDFYFNLSKAEVVEMQYSTGGGLKERLESIVNTKDQPAIIREFKKLILAAYGEKSPDGRQFMKSEGISKSFESTEAYSMLFMELATDADKAAEFVNGITPKIKADE